MRSSLLPVPLLLPGVLLVLLLALPTAASGQIEAGGELTLDRAVELALGSAGPRAATERALAADRARAMAEADRLPTLGARASGLATDDPVAVFGGKLRQGRFTEADLALGSLNDPAALTDLSVGIGAEWRALDFTVLRGIRAADAEAEAAAAMGRAARDRAAYLARVRYLAAVEGAAIVDAAGAALAAARATRDATAERVAGGTATESALLRARAAVAAREAELVRAEAAAADAGDALLVLLGRAPVGAVEGLEPAAMVVDRLIVAAGGIDGDPASRADLVAATARAEAGQARAAAADAGRLPTIAAFGEFATHTGAGDTGTRWTTGVVVELPLFTGGRVTRAGDALEAEARALRIEAAQRRLEAEAEVAAARRGLDAARRARVAAEAGAEAAREAARLTALRFREGLTTIAETLDAEAAAVEAETTRIRAAVDAGRAAAALILATGVAVSDDPPIAGASPADPPPAGHSPADAAPATTTPAPLPSDRSLPESHR